MNKTVLKNFATWSRRKLIEQVKTTAFLYGIDENNGLQMEEQFGQLVINGQTYPLSMKSSFTALQKQLEQKGYKQLLEEVSYTWFNRIIAIRYMEVHEYLPEKVNVLSSSVGRVDPDILFDYDTMDLAIKHEEVRELINAGNTEAAFRLLFVAQCNSLNRILPFMFEEIQDYTELLLPDFLLDAESVIKTLVQSKELTESFAEIEVIGWLYQYYIAEEKHRVFSQKSKYKKEEIPFATQLFTPKWIVQYMVQNSLGRYWTEAHQEDEDLIDKWEYFIKHEEEDFHEKIASYVNKELKVEDIKLLDPAMGSGHILVYAFEVFHEIYEKCGYPEREIPRLILENNLYGLDIDDRAYQLASFAVVMKAASYSKRFFRSVEREGIQLNLASIQETNHVSGEVISYIAQQEVGERYKQVKAFFDQHHNAKTYGSLINISERDITFIEERLEKIVNSPVEDLFYGEQHEIAKQVLPALIHQTKIMRNEYDVVVMNPPYMGASGMNKELGNFIKKNYPDSKSDLFAAFMEINHFLKSKGLYATINQHSWMFLSNFDDLRIKIMNSYFIDNMIHLGSRAFEEINGEVVQSTSFIYRNYKLENLNTTFFRLTDFNSSFLKEQALKSALNTTDSPIIFKVNVKELTFIAGMPLTYWINEKVLSIFKSNVVFENCVDAKVGLQTGDNKKFLRYWFEVDRNEIRFDCETVDDTFNFKWYPYNKGGSYRKWYGNREYVVNWEDNGIELRNFKNDKGKLKSRPQNTSYYFKESISWSDISTTNSSFRYYEKGFIFDTTGHSAFPNEKVTALKMLAVLNNKVFNDLTKMINPTIHFNTGYFNKLPAAFLNEDVSDIVEENIEISKIDWDSSEVSWDFSEPEILKSKSLLELKEAYEATSRLLNNRREMLKRNEELLNSKFINEYDLSNIYNEKVLDSEITLRIADKKEIAKELLSYFIGCLMGRFSLDKAGVIYSGGTFEPEIYKTFPPQKDGYVIFTENQYFTEDIISKLKEFLGEVFSPETIEKNIWWLASTLEIKENEDSEKRLRRYFSDEFYSDHCKMYQNHPIYWLLDSGKHKGLRTLIYMHRYHSSTMATIRFEHLQEIQSKYSQEIADIENRLVNPNLNTTDKNKLNAEKVLFEKKIDELREFDKRLAAIAAEEIEIDLEDGVKVNYEKFYRGGKGVLAKIK